MIYRLKVLFSKLQYFDVGLAVEHAINLKPTLSKHFLTLCSALEILAFKTLTTLLQIKLEQKLILVVLLFSLENY